MEALPLQQPCQFLPTHFCTHEPAVATHAVRADSIGGGRPQTVYASGSGARNVRTTTNSHEHARSVPRSAPVPGPVDTVQAAVQPAHNPYSKVRLRTAPFVWKMHIRFCTVLVLLHCAVPGGTPAVVGRPVVAASPAGRTAIFDY